MSKCWVYHKEEAPKLVNASEADEYYKDGWADTPAKFVDLSAVVDLSNETEVQMVGEVMDETARRANAQANLPRAQRPGLMRIVDDFGFEVDEDLSTPDLRAAIKELLDGDGA